MTTTGAEQLGNEPVLYCLQPCLKNLFAERLVSCVASQPGSDSAFLIFDSLCKWAVVSVVN